MKTATKTAATKPAAEKFSAVEREAMKDRAKELKAKSRSKPASAADAEAEVMEKIAELPPRDRAMAEKLHAIIREAAPMLTPRLWYGMPAYAKGDQTICHFVSAQKFKTRFSTLGFSDKANLDDGDIFATSYALMEMTPAVEAKITALVKKAVG